MLRRTPLRRRNNKRARARRERDFGERATIVRTMHCLASTLRVTPCAGAVEAAHAKSRGAGGTRRHLIPLCWAHHQEQHRTGVKTFATRHDLDLHEAALSIAVMLDARGLP